MNSQRRNELGLTMNTYTANRLAMTVLKATFTVRDTFYVEAVYFDADAARGAFKRAKDMGMNVGQLSTPRWGNSSFEIATN